MGSEIQTQMCGYVCACYRQKTEEDQELKRMAPIPKKRRQTISRLKSEQGTIERKSLDSDALSRERIQQELELEKEKNKQTIEEYKKLRL